MNKLQKQRKKNKRIRKNKTTYPGTGRIVNMSDRKYIIGKDGEYRRVYEK